MRLRHTEKELIPHAHTHKLFELEGGGRRAGGGLAVRGAGRVCGAPLRGGAFVADAGHAGANCRQGERGGVRVRRAERLADLAIGA